MTPKNRNEQKFGVLVFEFPELGVKPTQFAMRQTAACSHKPTYEDLSHSPLTDHNGSAA